MSDLSPQQNKRNSLAWAFKMAYRDSRRSRSRLILFTGSIILGVAALVAINTFGDNLRKDINEQSKELLGADLVIQSNQAFTDSANILLEDFEGPSSDEYAFSSMVLFPKTGDTRAVQVRAIEDGFPFFGKFETVPESAGQEFREEKKALVDQTLMMQYNAKVGDSIKIGNVVFEIAGKLLQVPGQVQMMSMVYAPVYIPMQYLDKTSLIKKGSRVTYKRYFSLGGNTPSEEALNEMRPRFRELRLRYDTVEERREDFGDAFEGLTRFLNLVAFAALLLGCVGVANSVHVYIKDKLSTVAILRCLGAEGGSTFSMYLIQILFMGLVGSVLGALLGSALQVILPMILREFLPISASSNISLPAMGEGIAVGMGIAVLFALLPLLAIRRVSPLMTLRASSDSGSGKRDIWNWLVILGIGLFIWGFAYLQIGEIQESLVFVGAMALGFLILAGAAYAVMFLLKRFFPRNWSFVFRQSIANLFRPNNQTLIMVVAIGMGTALITTLFFMQGMLVKNIALSDQGQRPDMVVYDVGPEDVAEITKLMETYDFPVVQDVPLVTMQLAEWKGRSRRELLKDTTRTVPRGGTLNREYRVTFRDSIIDSEEVVKGKWIGEIKNPGDSIFISVEEGFAQRSLKVDIGDEVVFDVSGLKLKTYIGSFRKVDFQRVQTNFIVLFPKGVLEEAPQFRVLITKTNSNENSAKFQRALAENYPDVSVIDLALILKVGKEILEKVSFVIQFMGFFSISIGLLVLIGSVINSKYQRIRESVLLRTLGGSRRKILMINAWEYIFLGFLAALTGILLALAASWALAKFSFEIEYAPDLGPAVGILIGIIVLTVGIGMLNIQGIMSKSPLEVLRREV
ncbi:MAG: FtsX-like permease family protein [Bacteroidia bacterium]|nr:FtsX-like permease family protein [Bacteroidia bacterium]